jgi:hypothetical protein
VGPERQRKKKKKRRTTTSAVAVEGESGLLGRKVREVNFLFFFFFPNLFSILFKSNSNQKPSNFSQNFINILEFTQATKNHAKPNNDAQSLVVSRLIK